ncbi:hypothetical protein MBLNU459_g5562t2 [Dothideomycetes sp. NU459]
MHAILPGKPQAQLQAVCAGAWEGQLVLAYISGSAVVICSGPDSLLQTIYHDDAGSGGLTAVAYHGATGKIAAADASTVYVYALHEEVKGELRWTLDLTLPLSLPPPLPLLPRAAPLRQQHGAISTLSWGSDDELLVGSTSLTLLSVHVPSPPSSPAPASTAADAPPPHLTWTRSLSSPVTHAAFSPSANLIATASRHDRLVKIWRRLSFESPLFDYAYLPHPAVVTHLEWRSGAGSAHGDDDVLYTVAADGRLRVWKTSLPHSIEILSLYAELDLFAVIQPKHSPDARAAPRRYVFLIPSDTFTSAVDAVLKDTPANAAQSRHAAEYLKEIASRKPDIAVVVDNHGHMSAWGLENVGCKRRHSLTANADFFHAAHVEDLVLGFEPDVAGIEDNARIMSFAVPQNPAHIALLVNHFDGRIQWWQSSVQNLFDPAHRSRRAETLATWTGHSSAIKKVMRTASGKALISRTDKDAGVVWKQKTTRDGSTLLRVSKAKLDEHIHRTTLLRDGDYAVFLHHDSISLWDARSPDLTEIARCTYTLKGKPLCLISLPEVDGFASLVHLATVTTDMQGITWELSLSPPSSQQNGHKESAGPSMRQFCTFDFGPIDNLAYFLPVDPAGSAPVTSGFMDSFAQDIAISWTSTGLLHTWTAKVDLENGSVDWLKLSETDTGIEKPSLGSGTSIRKAAMVDQTRSTLTIWDTKSGRLDYKETFEHQTIQDLDWASTPDNQSILSVGFPHAVFVYTQLRYDYVDERPAWGRIKEVSIRHLTPHPIGDSVWLGSGSLVVGAGNQFFVLENTINPRTDLSPDLQTSAPHKSSNHIYDVVRRLNGPLPAFHPQFISQCVLAGKMDIVHRVLLALHKALKFYTEGDELDSLLGFDVDDFMSSSQVTSNAAKDLHKSYSEMDLHDEPGSITEDVASALTALLTEKSIPQLSSREQFSLADVIECIGIVEKHRRSIDANATRFLLFWRESLLRSRQTAANNHMHSASTTSISWREMVWAYHSNSQDILVDIISKHHKGRLEWPHARNTGIFMWLTDREALLAQFEVIARNAYTSTDLKNPVDCSLYYLALRKKAVLLGLWRMATWSREQAATMRLLRNDFTDPRWKTAAAKNAYALMGRRRFEYAAAFFLLGDDLKSAVSVLSNQLGDTQLAIAVARVYGGDDCQVLQEFLQNKVLSAAAQAGNRWQATWCYWSLGQRSLAVRALINPLHSLLEPAGSPPDSLRAKSFLNDDPALVVLYKQLREKSLQTLKGALMISGKHEWEFVTKTASLLLRMGCDIIALDLVRSWEFLRQQASTSTPVRDDALEARETISELPEHKPAKTESVDFDPRKLLRRRSSLVVADLPDTTKPRAPDVAPRSMLDDWGVTQNTKQESAPISAPTHSLLDEYDSQPKKQEATAPAPARSMLDDWDMSGAKAKTQTNEPRPIVDEYSMTDARATKQSPAPAVRSMLDDWSSRPPRSESKKVPDEAKFGSAMPSQTAISGTANDHETSNAESEKKGGHRSSEAPEKKKPTQFKEPDPNSLLDAFGF